MSVCIANYNGENLLSECIDSVLAQQGDATIEIIVHDDASSDGSLHLLQARYSQVTVIRSDRNVGFCIANNRMADMASGQYLLLLNNDAALLPDAVATLLAAAGAQQPAGILTLPQYDWETGQLVDRGCLLDPFYTPVPNRDPLRRDVAYVIGACLWIPRALWRNLDGFPTWLGSIAEDMYLGCAARLRGYPVQAIPASGYRHRQGASFGGNRIDDGRLDSSYRRRYLSERNRLAVLAICTPTWLAWPWLTLHTIALTVEGLLLSLLKATPRIWREIYWAALHDAVRRRRELLDHRSALQSKRTIGLGTYMSGSTAMPRKLVLLFRHGLPGIRG
ncbi:GT2 family glycosyltransferase [Lysobacter niabensis]|uniref:GT2 family glycosyltransferase n=1 Tax=Agrilutibacter niabensis TaxID=380628 RepID=A0ABU1VJV4_9GAMM|nr:GT2 family glycosyltransferase [Lysobacter niabensis]